MPRKPRVKRSGVVVNNLQNSQRIPVNRSTIRIPIVSENGNGTHDGPIWMSRLAKTMRLRNEMKNGAKDWARYYRWFEGEQWNERGDEIAGSKGLATDNARMTATVNITGSIALSYVPFLINGEIKFKLTGRRKADNASAEIQQGLLQYEWDEGEMTPELKKSVTDVVVIGHGIIKTGYTLELDEARKKSDGEIDYRDYVRKDAPFIERVDPLLFLFDLSAKDGTLRTARWCAECFFVPYEDVLANADYDQSVLAQITTGTYTIGTRAGFEGIGQEDPTWGQKLTTNVPEDSLVPLWEVWDKKFKKRYIFAEGVPLPLVEEAWPYDYIDGFPYIKCDYIRVPNKPYGMGVMRLAEDQQLQLNRIRTAQHNHVRAFGRKFTALQPGVDNEAIKDWADLPDGAIIPISAPDAIKPISDATMSTDYQIVEQRIQSDIEQLTGADALLQGRPLPSRTTAGEVSARTNIMRLKADDRVTAVEEFVTLTATQVLQHLQANKTIPDVVRIVGKQGVYWQNYSSEDIQGEVSVTVEYFAAPKFDPATDRQQRLNVLQLATQAMPALLQSGAAETINFPALLGWVLKSFETKDVAEFFIPARTPTPPIEEAEPGVGGGAMAPAPIPQQPGVPPGAAEGISPQDILQQLQGGPTGAGGFNGAPIA